ncbi:MAG TPA: RNA methyltransferase [Acidimicrobiales bacterium]
MPVVAIDGSHPAHALADERLSDYAALNQVETRREVERRGGFFIAESELVIRELVATRERWPLRSVLVTTARYDAMTDVLDVVAAEGVPVFVTELAVVRAVTGFHVHRGVLASADRPASPPRVEDVVGGASLVAVLEGIADHENVGSIFRSAAAFGIGAIVLDPSSADPLYRRSVRVSMGHVLRVPFARDERWADVLRSLGFTIAALTPAPDAIELDELVAARDRGDHGRVAVVLGAEGEGLTAATLAAADCRVRIPIDPSVDSLNVGVAAAVAFHALRQTPRR